MNEINGNYTAIGGTLSTAGNIIVNGAYVDVTKLEHLCLMQTV